MSERAERERRAQEAKLSDDVDRLVKEHDDKQGLPLTPKAARVIIETTQPADTRREVSGEHVPKADIRYFNSGGDRVFGVEVKTAKNLYRAADAVRATLRQTEDEDIIALIIPSDSDVPRFLGKLRAMDSTRICVRRLFAVDPDGNVLIDLQPFPWREQQ